MRTESLIVMAVLISIVLVSGCIQTQEQTTNDASGNRILNQGTEPTENEIPTPEIPQGENEEPPNLPI